MLRRYQVAVVVLAALVLGAWLSVSVVAQQGQILVPGQAYPQGQAYPPQGQSYPPQGQSYPPQGQAASPPPSTFLWDNLRQGLFGAPQPNQGNPQGMNRGAPQGMTQRTAIMQRQADRGTGGNPQPMPQAQ